MFRILLTLSIQVSNQYESKIFCNENETYFYGQSWVPISLQKNHKTYNLLEQNQELLTLIANITIENLNDNRELVLKQYQQNQLQLIFKEKDHYLCKFIIFKFIFENNILKHYEEILQDKFTFQLPLCIKLIEMYYIDHQIFIFCEQELYLQLFVLERNQNSNDPFNLTLSATSKLFKQQNCNYELQYYKQIYILFLNCQDWIVYVVEDNNFKIFIVQKQSNKEVLRNMQIQDDIILQYDYEIQIMQANYEILLFKSAQSQQILYFFSQDHKYVVFYQGENKMELINDGYNQLLLVTNQQIPKQVLKIYNKLIINYGSYLEIIERIDAQFIVQVSIDYLINQQLDYPFFYAFQQNQIILFLKNNLTLTIQCNELIQYDYIFYKSNHLFTKNRVIKEKITKNNNFIQNIQIDQNLRGKKFSFKLVKPFVAKENYLIWNDNQINLNCRKEQNLQQCNCGNSSYGNIIWQKLKYNKELYLLFQNSNQKLFLKNCDLNLLMELGRFEIFDKQKVYDYKSFYFILFKKQNKILIIECKSDQFNKKIIETKDIIIDLYFENYLVYLLSNSCNSFVFLYKQYYFSYNNKYIQREGKCIQTLLFNDYLGYVYNGSIYMLKNSITQRFIFENTSIINAFKITSYQSNYIIHSQNQDGDLFSRYLFVNNQFIKLFDFPKLNFKYSSPLIYQANQNIIVVAAYENYINHVLLVYYYSHDYQNSLINIIKVDNFNFSITDQAILIFNEEIKIINIQYDQFYCEISQFYDFVKNIKLPINYISMFNHSQNQFSIVNLNLYNLNKDLSYKEFRSIQIQDQVFPLDPRQFTVGPIDQIYSTDLSILNPIQKQGQILKVQCQRLINQACINQDNKQIIFNPFFNQEIITLTHHIDYEIQDIIKYQDLIFFLCQKEQYFTLLVYNKLELFLYQIDIPQLCFVRMHMQIYLNFYILLCPKLIQFYKIENDLSLNPFSVIETLCMDCYVREIVDANFTLLYLPSNNSIQDISLITIYDDIHHNYFNRIQVEIFQFHIEFYLTFIFQNISYFNSSYYKLSLMQKQQVGFMQYFEAFLDKREGVIIINQDYFLIRHFHNAENIKFIHLLGKDTLIIVNDFPIGSTIQVYNISNISKIKYIDYIFNFSLDSSSQILPYDDQHFIIYSQIQNDYSLYRIEPYKLILKEQEENRMFIEFQNSVSSLKMEIIKITSQQFKINYYYICIMIVFTLLICCLLKFLHRNKHKSFNIPKEIEL